MRHATLTGRDRTTHFLRIQTTRSISTTKKQYIGATQSLSNHISNACARAWEGQTHMLLKVEEMSSRPGEQSEPRGELKKWLAYPQAYLTSVPARMTATQPHVQSIHNHATPPTGCSAHTSGTVGWDRETTYSALVLALAVFDLRTTAMGSP